MTHVLVLGAGSAGARHARELEAVGASVDVADPVPDRAASAGAGRAVPFDLGRLGGYDGIVVASPTAFHLEQAGMALAAGARVLVEKPLAASGSGLDRFVDVGEGRVMVGYNLRFHEPVRRLVQLIHAGKAGVVSSVRLWFGSWLPNWRPGTDYRQAYSARADLGGGVLLDAIHEIDLLLWLVGGGPMDVAGAVVDRLGPLDIDVEDTVKAILHRPGLVAEVSLDYLSRRYRRGMEVTGDTATVRLDWARGLIEVEDGDGYSAESAAVPVGRSYRRQAEHFLSFVRGEAEPEVGARQGAASVHLADRIRATAGCFRP